MNFFFTIFTVSLGLITSQPQNGCLTTPYACFLSGRRGKGNVRRCGALARGAGLPEKAG